MAAPASSSLFTSLANAWRLLSLRSDIDDIILETLGRFSLEKIYSEGNKVSYQHVVTSLLVQLSTIFDIQRLSLPSEGSQIGWYLGFIASVECTLRTVEYVLSVVVEGRDSLWECTLLRDRYLAEFLFSALRVLTLHPKTPANQRAKDRRERFARIHQALERFYDSYPGPKSFLLIVCTEITDCLRNDPNSLALPPRLRYELPNLASELYPLPECLSSQYVSTIVPRDTTGVEWLAQFLALRDISMFVVGASIQYTVNREIRDVRLQSSSARTRNAILLALDNMRIPGQLSRADLVLTFSEVFRVILPDTPSLSRGSSNGMQGEETEMDAINSFCMRLNDRQVVHRVSDREMMHNMLEITRNIALLDDPSGQFRTGHPKLYVLNCSKAHLVGESQLKVFENLKLPLDPDETPIVKLPPHSKCIQCREDVKIAREISLARHTWGLLKPLEPSPDTINVERHLPTQFQIPPPREANMTFPPAYSMSSGSQRSDDTGSFSRQNRPTFLNSTSIEHSPSTSQALQSPTSPHNPQVSDPASIGTSSYEAMASPVGISMDYHLRGSSSATETLCSPTSVTLPIFSDFSQGRMVPTASTASIDSHDPASLARTRTVPVVAVPEKGKSGWRSKFGSKKDSCRVTGDTSSPSSTSLEPQRLDEISLKSLSNTPKTSSRSKNAKVINVYLSQNSPFALFWTQASIHVYDVSSSPPTLVQMIATESTCLLAALTKVHLAYIVGTRDQRLTLRIINLLEPTTPIVEYRMPSSIWCRSIAVCPKENYVVLGFENSTVRFFKTTPSSTPREDRLHERWHKEPKECKECPPVETLSFSNDGLKLLGTTRDPKNGTIHIYSWSFPFITFQELSACRYHVPLHECEDNGVSSAIFQPGRFGDENLICVTTWTQSGAPVLMQPGSGSKNIIKTEISTRQGRIGNRVQCAAFSPSGNDLALVNDKGHLYQLSNLHSSPMEVKRMATSPELTSKTDSFAMTYVVISEEEAPVIVMAWTDPSRAMGYIKRVLVTPGDSGVPSTPMYETRSELHGESRNVQRSPVEMDVEKPDFPAPLRIKRDSKSGQ